MTALAITLVVATAVASRAAFVAARGRTVRRRLSAPLGSTGRGVAGRLPSPPRWFVRWLDDAGSDTPPSTAWWVWLGGGVAVGAAAVLVLGPAPAVLATTAAAIGPAVALRTRRGHGAVRLEQSLPVALEAVARSLRSGASLRQAIGEAANATPTRLGRELAQVTRQVGHGASLVDALEALAARRPLPGVRLTVAALCLCVETGGARARAVDGVAATLRDRQAVAGELRALSAQARISALVIGLAPVAFGAFSVMADPRTGEFLFHTPVGLALMAAGIALDGLGWLWMQHLTRVAA